MDHTAARQQGRPSPSQRLYDFRGFDKATSIAQIGEDRGAWFKDSEGNLLGILRQR